MDELSEFNIPFVGLKEGKHSFDFDIDKTFFKKFDFSDFQTATLKVDLTFDKKPSMMDLTFRAHGKVGLICDVSNEAFDYIIQTQLNWIVKFGDHFDDDHDEYIILPHGSYQVNVSQPIYEMIVLAIPLKKVHPGIEDGTLDSDIVKKIEALHPTTDQSKEIDPRWDKLKDLL